jgi:hypothetical protein
MQRRDVAALLPEDEAVHHQMLGRHFRYVLEDLALVLVEQGPRRFLAFLGYPSSAHVPLGKLPVLARKPWSRTWPLCRLCRPLPAKSLCFPRRARPVCPRGSSGSTNRCRRPRPPSWGRRGRSLDPRQCRRPRTGPSPY